MTRVSPGRRIQFLHRSRRGADDRGVGIAGGSAALSLGRTNKPVRLMGIYAETYFENDELKITSTSPGLSSCQISLMSRV